MNISKIITLLAIVVLFASLSFAQEVKYSIETNSPKSAVLSVGISPLEFFLLAGEPMGGPGIQAYFRPSERLKVQAKVSSALYLNDSREVEGASGIKKLGGIFGEAHAEFSWLRKGINLTSQSGTLNTARFNVKATGNTINYINFPYNRVVERTIRVGGFYNNYPLQNNTQSAGGVFVGLGRTGRRYAKLNFEGYGTKEQGITLGYYVDLMFGGVAAIDPTLETESGSGARIGIDLESTGGLCPVLTNFEVGSMPGAGGYMRLSFTFAIQSGGYLYNGSYKERKAAKKTIPALIRSI